MNRNVLCSCSAPQSWWPGSRLRGCECRKASVGRHARLVVAPDARDIAAYRAALEGYEDRTRNAYRKAKGGEKSAREAEIARIVSAPLSYPQCLASFREC